METPPLGTVYQLQFAEAAIVAGCPEHIVGLLADGAAGTAFTVTVTGVTTETHPVPVQVIFAIPFPNLPVIVDPAGFGITALPAISWVLAN